MLDLILKLIDRCIALAKRREESNKEVYSNFVAPIFDDFEEVHKNYLESIRRYRDLLKDSDIALNENHPIFEELWGDSLFSASIRAKVQEVISLKYDPIIGKFIEAIERYIYWLEPLIQKILIKDKAYYREMQLEDFRFELTLQNTIRGTFGDQFSLVFSSKIPENYKRELGLGILDFSLVRLQNLYQGVVQEHIQLKRRLLSSM